MGDGSGGLAAGEEVGGEIVKFSGLEAEGFGEEADLDLGGGVTGRGGAERARRSAG